MATGPAELVGDDLTSLARSTQAYPSSYAIYARRGSLKPPEPDTSRRGPVSRPTLQTRTHSAPSIHHRPRQTDPSPPLPAHYHDQSGSDASEEDQSNDDNDDDDDDDDDDEEYEDAPETGHVFSTMPNYSIPSGHAFGPPKRVDSLPSPTTTEHLSVINVAVIGADGVGKTTFLQRALDLPSLPRALSVEQKVFHQSSQYLVRLLEIPINDVNVDDDDDTICWPDTVGDRMTPKIDGALTLYDVKDKASLNQVPGVLTALSKASMPSILISCKCDVAPFERDLDPVAIEEKAKRSVRNLITLQTSNATSDNHKRSISMIIRAVLSRASVEYGSGRRRAKSNALRHLSPRDPYGKGHLRAASEHSTLAMREKSSAHDQLPSHGSRDRLKLPFETGDETMQRSFLIEESATEDSSAENSGGSVTGDTSHPPAADTLSSESLSANGATFDDLIDRLLAQPISKSDSKFAAIFLALYRKFAAPGRLLEAIVARYDTVSHSVVSELTRTTTQQRYLEIIYAWISDYPGDFAFAKTKRRMHTFISKIGSSAMFAVTASEMNRELVGVQENDDTDWAYTDRDREVFRTAQEFSALSTSATGLLDDLEFTLPDSLSGLSATEDVSIAATLTRRNSRPLSNSSTTSSQVMLNFAVAQREAEMVMPMPRTPLSKEHWHTFMAIPDDTVASELTRMDWIMFASIRPRDLVRHVSLGPLEKEACRNLANVDRMINHFNRVASWVSNLVLLRDRPKFRALVLEKFMRVARKLRELNNYNSLGAVIAGIKSTAIHRLAATRDLLPPAAAKDWMKLEILMSPTRSHAAYRLAWENSSSERIPYLPLHRRDLVSAEEGNKTFVNDETDGRINWKKFEIMGEVVVSMQRAQGLPYHGLAKWKGGEQVKELILDLQLLDDEELYDRSTQIEPPANSGATTSTRFREFFKR